MKAQIMKILIFLGVVFIKILIFLGVVFILSFTLFSIILNMFFYPGVATTTTTTARSAF